MYKEGKKIPEDMRLTTIFDNNTCGKKTTIVLKDMVRTQS